MASSKCTNTYNRQNWEDSKDTYGKECKICSRPFTVFRWCPGPKSRYKKTEICQTCAKVKNVCQTCIFDLEYGLPVEVRDKAIRQAQLLPRSQVNREYFHQQLEQQLEDAGDITAPYGGHELVGKALSNTAAASSTAGGGAADLLLKLARTAPYYKRNRPHICSFWVKGECRRGEECPYRHEKPTDPDDPLSDQNLKDRYYGNADPVAAKLIAKYDSLPKLTPPEDKTITTLYIGGVPEAMTETDLRNHFYQFGELRSVHVHHKQHCAFLQFAHREAAERAAERTYDRLILNGHRLSVNWGKSPAATATTVVGDVGPDGRHNLPPVPGLPLPLVAPPQQLLSAAVSVGMTGGFALPKPPPMNPFVQGNIPLPGNTTGTDFMLRGPMPPNLPPVVTGTMPSAPPPPLVQTNVAKASLLQQPGGQEESGGTADVNGAALPPAVSHSSQLGVHYPSQNPQRMGSMVPASQKHE